MEFTKGVARVAAAKLNKKKLKVSVHFIQLALCASRCVTITMRIWASSTCSTSLALCNTAVTESYGLLHLTF